MRKWYIKPVGEMAEPYGEATSFLATITGEIQVADIPLGAWADLDALKAGDQDCMEVVVEVPAGKSKRGWNYKPEALQKIVGEVMAQGLPGFLGHQKPENVDTEFPQPVTHWVGAAWKDNKAYFRGVVDKSASDLKRWIKAKVVRTVSIFGVPKLQKVQGETHVVDYKPMSIDWTPLGRAGMPTKIVATGEIDDVSGEFDGSYEELKPLIKEAVVQSMGIKVDGPGSDYLWVNRVWSDHAIVEHESNGITKLYNFPYSVLNEAIILGDKKEVVKKIVFEPAGEMKNENGGGQDVTWKEYLAKIKALIQSGEVTVQQVAGEMGWTAQQMARALDENWLNQVTGEMAVMGKIKEIVTGDNPAQVVSETFATLGKVKTALGVTGEMDIVVVATEAGKAAGELKKAQQTDLIDGVLKEKVSGEMAQALVRKMLVVPEAATKEQVAGEIDKILADETIKSALSQAHLDRPLHVGGGNNGGEPKFLRKKSASI